MGSNEDAAQKRVSRALGKLHSILKREGISLSAAALGTALATEAVSAAPAGLAVSISSTVLASASLPGGATLTLLKIMTMTKLKLSVIGAIGIAAVGTPLVIQYQALAKLREENVLLRQQAEERTQLATENQQLTNRLAELKSSESMANEQRSELVRLRAELEGLRSQKQTPPQGGPTSDSSAKTQAPLQRNLAAPTVPLLPVSRWANVGTATPEASWQTLRWALANRDATAFAQVVAWDPNVQSQAQSIFDAASETTRQKFGSVDGVLYAMMTTPGVVDPNVTAFGLVPQNIEGDDGTLIVQEQHTDGQVKQDPVPVHHFDDGWRILLPPKMLNQFSRFLDTPNTQPPNN